MLTPRFELSQNESEITIKIYAPYANIKDSEVYVEKEDFRFYSSPYYLRLKLPGEIVENDSSFGSYDCDAGEFTLKFDKVNKGEDFKDLDMITTLLAPPREPKNIAPTIEVIGNPAVTDDAASNENTEDSEENNWFFPQSVAAQHKKNILINAPKYGFANKLSGVLGSFEEGWLKDVVTLPNPDQTPMNERKSLREAAEFRDFNKERYAMHFIDQYPVQSLIDFVPEWYNLTPDKIILTDREKDILKELPNKEFLLDNDEIQTIIFGLVDILFGLCYTYRTNTGEYTVESGWDVNKLSATLSWFENYSNMNEVIITSIKRSLCYPLFRHWELSMKIFEDVKKIIRLGKKYILKYFCDIYELFNNSYEPRYILNQLFIRDYLIYLQKIPDSLIETIAETLDDITPTKESTGFRLDMIEKTALSENELHCANHRPEYFINNIVDGVDKLELDDETDTSSRSSSSDEPESENTTCSCSNKSSSTTSSSSSSCSDTCECSDSSKCYCKAGNSSSINSDSDDEELDSDDTTD